MPEAPDTPTMAIRDVVTAKERAAVAREFNRALRAGEIVRVSACAWCGSTEGTMDGHHPDYARPLMVVWLCKPCHRQHHRTYRDESRFFGRAPKNF